MRGRSGCGACATKSMAPTAAGMAKSRFTYIAKRHDRYSVSTPPRIRPIAPPAPAMAPKMPNARARSLPDGKVVVSSESAAGASSAPKTPCSARAATSTSKLWAAPPIADAMAKPTSPATNVHLRPNRSPMRPPSSSRLPNASAYAVTIHWREPSEKCRAACAEGSAMFTTVASSTTISCAMLRMARIHQRWLPEVSRMVGSGAWSGVLDRGGAACSRNKRR